MVRARAWSYFLVLPAFILLMGARAAPLIDPDPIAVPAGLAQPAVTKAVKAAIIGRGWLINEDEPGRLVATLNLRAHMAKIEVAYDETAVNIRYLDSRELRYEEKNGERFIHRNYGLWIRNVVTDISRNLQMAAL